MIHYRQCINCGIEIEKPFWLCQSCEDMFGLAGVPYRFWPLDVKRLRNEAERNEARSHLLISLDALVDSQDLAGQLSDRITPRPLSDSDLLRHAPYADEAANRADRKSVV